MTKEEQIADGWIKEMQRAGFTPDQMKSVIEKAREMHILLMLKAFKNDGGRLYYTNDTKEPISASCPTGFKFDTDIFKNVTREIYDSVEYSR